jgi:hypothetical protein
MALDEATNPVKGVSGPGKFAKRTDLEVQSTGYGDKTQYQANKSGASLATAPKSPMLSQAPRASSTPVTGLYDSTARPNEPVTQGVDAGAGAGPEALAMRGPDDANFRTAMMQYLPVLNFVSDQPNTSPETRAAIRQIMDNL